MLDNYEMIHLESCPSTNDYLKGPLPDEVDLELPVFVLADQQTAGRGRLGRSWSSPEGGIYLSLRLPFALHASQAICLPLVTALAVRAACQPLTRQKLSIKWPNDILVVEGDERRKLSGILVELHENRAIIGIGVNVYSVEPDDAPANGGLPKAWLSELETDKPLLEQAVNALTEQLISYINRWQAAGFSFSSFADEYQAHMALLGEAVQVHDGQGGLIASGEITGIDQTGHLIVQNDQGQHLIHSGEVTFRTILARASC